LRQLLNPPYTGRPAGALLVRDEAPGMQAAASRLDDMVFKKENKLKRELKLKHIMINSY
jgi:hypothetical protein